LVRLPAKLLDMNLSNLSANQLRQAATIKDQIEQLQVELTGILGASAPAPTAPDGRSQKRTVSAATRAKMAAAQQRRWAAKQPTRVVAKPQGKGKMSAAAKKKLSEFQKARWAKINAAKIGKVVPAATPASKPVPASTPAPKKKWKLSAAGLARIKAANKAFWAKRKAAKK